MTLSGRGILSFLPNLEVFINDLLGEDVRAQAQLEFFGPTLTQKPGSTLGAKRHGMRGACPAMSMTPQCTEAIEVAMGSFCEHMAHDCFKADTTCLHIYALATTASGHSPGAG